MGSLPGESLAPGLGCDPLPDTTPPMGSRFPFAPTSSPSPLSGAVGPSPWGAFLVPGCGAFCLSASAACFLVHSLNCQHCPQFHDPLLTDMLSNISSCLHLLRSTQTPHLEGGEGHSTFNPQEMCPKWQGCNMCFALTLFLSLYVARGPNSSANLPNSKTARKDDTIQDKQSGSKCGQGFPSDALNQARAKELQDTFFHH